MERNDILFSLVKSLSKSEKRQFKLYAGRLGGNSEKNFMNLFTVLDKMEVFDEKIILNKTNIKKQQLSNSKAHLYKQILVSLRLNPVHQTTKTQIRETLDYATILYNKGLHKQSLKLLDKAKGTALQNEENNLAYEIVELEKTIETQYITRSLRTRAEDLVNESEELSSRTVIMSKLSNLSLQLYGMLLKDGYVRTPDDYKKVHDFFHSNLPNYEYQQLGFKEKLFLYKAYLWYSFITQDFVSCYRYAKKWVNLFHQFPKMKKTNPVFYIKGVNYLLESLYFIQHLSKFEEALFQFESDVTSNVYTLNDNTEALTFQYLYAHKLNFYFLEGSFEKGVAFLPEVLAKLKQYESRLDAHHIMVFYYKIASMYFGNQQYEDCIYYLELIIKNKSLKMRDDLLCFTRILNLVAHYEAGIDQNLDALIKSTYKFLIKMNELHEVQRKFIAFLKSLSNIYPHELKTAFKKLHKELEVYEDHPFEKRVFMYLDVLSWLESNIENKPVSKIIKEKAISRYR